MGGEHSSWFASYVLLFLCHYLQIPSYDHSCWSSKSLFSFPRDPSLHTRPEEGSQFAPFPKGDVCQFSEGKWEKDKNASIEVCANTIWVKLFQPLHLLGLQKEFQRWTILVTVVSSACSRFPPRRDWYEKNKEQTSEKEKKPGPGVSAGLTVGGVAHVVFSRQGFWHCDGGQVWPHKIVHTNTIQVNKKGEQKEAYCPPRHDSIVEGKKWKMKETRSCFHLGVLWPEKVRVVVLKNSEKLSEITIHAKWKGK